MLFNSFEFAIFFFVVFFLYFLLRYHHKFQNRMLLVASCIFYAAWNWKFLFLMLFSTSVDFFCALRIHTSDNDKTRKRFLLISIIVNLALLGFFKYFNFFTGNLQSLLSLFGLSIPIIALNIILPLGISFYTFEAMSYVLDVYRRELEPTKNYFDYALFVLYFPHLIAGPIMRAKNLLSQITTPRQLTLEKFYEGCFLVFWGLFQKIYVADNLAKIVDPVFSTAMNIPFIPDFMAGRLLGPMFYNGSTVLLAMYAFTFQIYCDFCGYSNMARGLGLMMGFDITVNFNTPFFATNVQDFWNRWHISLSLWFRDYVYLPLIVGFYRIKGNARIYWTLLVTMTLIGLWHGAAWHFVLFGVYYGILLCLYFFIRMWWANLIVPKSQWGIRIWFLLRVLLIFHLTVVGMMLFRCDSVSQAFYMVNSLLFNLHFDTVDFETVLKMTGFLSILLLVEVLQYLKSDLLIILKLNPVVRAIFYMICFYMILFNGDNGGKQFIYFQF